MGLSQFPVPAILMTVSVNTPWETNKHSNKTIIQAIRFHMERNQQGWVCALPRIRFNIMNTVNKSTGFSPFQLQLGRSLRIIPPMVPADMLAEDWSVQCTKQIKSKDWGSWRQEGATAHTQTIHWVADWCEFRGLAVWGTVRGPSGTRRDTD